MSTLSKHNLLPFRLGGWIGSALQLGSGTPFECWKGGDALKSRYEVVTTFEMVLRQEVGSSILASGSSLVSQMYVSGRDDLFQSI